MARTQNITKCASRQQIWHTLALRVCLRFLGKMNEGRFATLAQV
jgi:hypothetical protein